MCKKENQRIGNERTENGYPKYFIFNFLFFILAEKVR